MSFKVEKRQTKDIGAGLSQLLWECQPADPPDEFLKSPSRTPFTVTVHETPTTPPAVFRATRMTILDRGNGKIGLQLAISPGEIPSEIAYAPNGSVFEADIDPAPHSATASLPVAPEERIKVLKRLVMLTRDPGFVDHLRTLEDGWLIDECERDDPKDVEISSIEVVLRHIRANSRSEILNDALVADRAEELIRAYRTKIYKERDAR